MNERDIFISALQKEHPAQRQAYLDEACAGQTELRQRVEELLRLEENAGSFLESPAAGLPAPFAGSENGGKGAATVDEVPAEGSDAYQTAYGSCRGRLYDELPLAEHPDTVIGSYKLLEQIGEGGFGVVFLAEQTEPVRRKVALKVLKPGMDTRQVVARFEQERQALALMDHPNIARILDGGATPSGRPYFVMELVKGAPLTDFCDQHQLTSRQRLELFVSVCQAVQHAHQKGIIHRDLKPSNVLVSLHDTTPVVKVIDFGIAKALGQALTDKTLFTGFAQMVGTPLYMSPEQAGQSGLDADTRSDVYSLGVLLYELLTGTTPFDKERLRQVSYDELCRIIREEEPPRPSTRFSTLGPVAVTISAKRQSDPRKLSQLMRGELDWIVMKALEKDRNRRYESPSAFAADVQRYLHDEPVLACPPSAWYRFHKLARRNKGRLVVAAGVFLAVTVMATSIGWAVRDRQAQKAESQRQEKARLAAVELQVSASWQDARLFLAKNNLSAARQKVAEARAQMGQDRPTLGRWAAQLDALEHDLDRFQHFVDLIEQARTAETLSFVTLADEDNWHGDVATLRPFMTWGRRPAAAVPLLLAALQGYQVLERDDWITTLEGGLLGKDQVAQVRLQAYEELLWLADDMLRRQLEHRSGQTLSAKAAAKRALVYLAKAETAHPATQALYVLRGRCQKTLGDKAAAQADVQRAARTAPTLALDHTQRGWAAFDAGQLRQAIQAFEAALRLDPTHYWSMMGLGIAAMGVARTPEDFAGVSRIFTGCILKRPDHGHAYLYRGVIYSMLGRHQEALADCSRAVELDPKSKEAWYNRGNAYGRLGQPDKAIADYSRVIELDEQFAPAWNNRGGCFNKLRQPDKALADFSQAIKLVPKNPFIWFNRGHLYDGQGKLARAVKDYSRAIELDPKFISAWFARGEAYDKLGQHDKARADYNAAIRLDPTDVVTPYARNTDHRLKRFWSDRGRANWHLRRFKEAVADFSRAIELDKEYAPAWYNRGNAYADLGQPGRAVEDCTQAIKLDAKDALGWNNRGAAYVDLREWDKAVKDFSRALELDEKLAPAWCNRGSVYHKLNQTDKAIADLSRALELDRKFVLAWYYRGVDYLRLGQLEKALIDFSEAIKRDPKNASFWNDRGVTHMRLEQLEKAIADYNEALKRDDKNASTWLNRGIAYTKWGHVNKAVADLSRAVDLDPKLALAYYRRGVAYLDHLGRPDRAIPDFTRFIELEKKVELAFFNRGVAYTRLGQWEKAIADFSSHLKVDEKDAKTWYNRGVSYLQLGRPDKAIPDLSRAIDIDGKSALTWINRGAAYVSLGRPDRAVADYTEAIKLDPKLTLAWYNRGIAYGKLHQLDKAVADYTEAIKLNEKFSQAWCNRGLAYSRMGQTDKAVADYSRALALEPRDWIALACRGDAYRQLGKLAQARADYEEALKWTPANARILNGLAWLLATCPEAKVRDPDQAVERAKKAVQLAPRAGSYWSTLGVAHYRAGDWKAAVAALDRSVQLRRGGDAIVGLFLAMAHRKLGNHDEARKWYDGAVEWLEKNEETLAKDRTRAEELRRFRSEAEEVLELKKK